MVECSFITEFEDHIFVTVDADAFFFLHDLITSYLKEKEKVVSIFCKLAIGGHLVWLFCNNSYWEIRRTPVAKSGVFWFVYNRGIRHKFRLSGHRTVPVDCSRFIIIVFIYSSWAR